MLSKLTIAISAGVICLGFANLSQAQNFKPVFVDKADNLGWSPALPGSFSNGCVNSRDLPDERNCTVQYLSDGTPQVKLSDSESARACALVGGRLPTKPEFESLLRSFDHQEVDHYPNFDFAHLKLSKKGLAQMQAVFHDMDETTFWTSTIARTNPEVPNQVDSAFHFSTHSGDIYGVDNNRHDRYQVRCVRSL